MARQAYKAEKRRKEMARLKKQEEKRQRRFAGKGPGEEEDTDLEQTAEGAEGIGETERNEAEGGDPQKRD